MTLSGTFVVAAGGVTGGDHRRAERDGQDGYAVVVSESVVAVVVTDGCSSGKRSEIGARVGASWIAAIVEQTFQEPREQDSHEETWARGAAGRVAEELLRRLEVLARSFDPAGHVHSSHVGDALLFGFLAAVVTKDVAIVFGIGDGTFVVGDAVTVIDPGPNNAPPYIAYGLLREPIEPVVHFVGRAADVAMIAVATDGVSGIEHGELVELAADARYARNPSLLRKRLIVRSDAGCFSDDATVGVVQRRPAADSSGAS